MIKYFSAENFENNTFIQLNLFYLATVLGYMYVVNVDLWYLYF